MKSRGELDVLIGDAGQFCDYLRDVTFRIDKGVVLERRPIDIYPHTRYLDDTIGFPVESGGFEIEKNDRAKEFQGDVGRNEKNL